MCSAESATRALNPRFLATSRQTSRMERSSSTTTRFRKFPGSDLDTWTAGTAAVVILIFLFFLFGSELPVRQPPQVGRRLLSHHEVRTAQAGERRRVSPFPVRSPP